MCKKHPIKSWKNTGVHDWILKSVNSWYLGKLLLIPHQLEYVSYAPTVSDIVRVFPTLWLGCVSDNPIV